MAGRKGGDEKGGSTLVLRVTPRASRNEITQILDDGTVKVKITAPPVEGKANETLIRYLADVLDVPPSRVMIVAGHSGRDKRIHVLGLDEAAVQQRIRQCLKSG